MKLRYFFVSYIERSGEYEFTTNHVMQTKSTRADATAFRMIKSQYDNVEVEYDKIIVNHWDICISHINVQQITKEEYDVLSKYITHI
jgi:histidyl-tRNA synthetase